MPGAEWKTNLERSTGNETCVKNKIRRRVTNDRIDGVSLSEEEAN